MSSHVHCNIHDINEEELKVIESRMFPGRLSIQGFLQHGESLADVLFHDRQTLKKCEITNIQIADALESVLAVHRSRLFIDYYEKTNKSKELIFDRFRVEEVTYMGAQLCPFQNDKLDSKYHGYEYGDTDVVIFDESRDSISFNTLLIHMIRDHHFFESPNVTHRVDPLKVIRFLNLKPNVVYKPVYYYKTILNSFSQRMTSNKSEFQFPRDQLKHFSICNSSLYNGLAEVYILSWVYSDLEDFEQEIDEEIKEGFDRGYTIGRRLILEREAEESERADKSDIEETIRKEKKVINHFIKTGEPYDVETKGGLYVYFIQSSALKDILQDSCVQFEFHQVKYTLPRGFGSKGVCRFGVLKLVKE